MLDLRGLHESKNTKIGILRSMQSGHMGFLKLEFSITISTI